MLDPRNVGRLRLSETHKTYTMEVVQDAYVLYSDEVNHLLRSTPLRLRLLTKRFRLTEPVKSFAAFILREKFSQGAALYNSPKVRLATDLTIENIGNRHEMVVQPTEYYAGVCTNETTGLEIRSRKTKKQVFDGYSLMSNSGIILDLAESHCSNHIAASTLAFTADRKLVVQRQASTAFIDNNRLVSSGSGSTDLRDIDEDVRTLQELIVTTMKRELIEECGLPKDTVISSLVTGYARFLNRGGKPEFFGVSYMGVNSQVLRIRPSETVFIADLDPQRVDREDVEVLARFLRSFRENPGNLISLDLHLNLLFLENLLYSSPDDFLRLFQEGQSRQEMGRTDNATD